VPELQALQAELHSHREDEHNDIYEAASDTRALRFSNLEGYKSLRTYTRPVTLCRSDGNVEWLNGMGEDIDWIDDIFEDKKEYDIIPKNQMKFVAFANKTQLDSGLLGANMDGLYTPDN